MIDGEGEAHALVVDGAGAPGEVFEEADEEDVEEEASEEGEEEGAVGGGEGEEGERDREPEATIAGDF